MKGVNRHEHTPDKAKVMDTATMVEDIKLMKRFNVNAVRTSHYPNDPVWYDPTPEVVNLPIQAGGTGMPIPFLLPMTLAILCVSVLHFGMIDEARHAIWEMLVRRDADDIREIRPRAALGALLGRADAADTASPALVGLAGAVLAAAAFRGLLSMLVRTAVTDT